MAKKDYILGVNLKMYMSAKETHDWLKSVTIGLHGIPSNELELFVLPSAPLLKDSIDNVQGTSLLIGAQNCATKQMGAATGEISPQLLKEIGCRYVLVGHYERRSKFFESDSIINQKIKAILKSSLTPILCLGEVTKSNPSAAEAEIRNQLETALTNIDHESRIIIAYEPSWAIGAEQPASVGHIKQICRFIRNILDEKKMTHCLIIYGGTAGEGLLEQISERCDGLFLGRKVHNPSVFLKIVQECINS